MSEQVDGCLKLGDRAPAFEAQTTNGKISFPKDFN